MAMKKYIALNPLDGKMLITSENLDEILKAPVGSIVLFWVRYPTGGYEYYFIGVL